MNWLCLFLLFDSASASPWNPNEGALADQVLAADGRGEWVTARRLAQELLDEQPLSYVGHHVLGRAFWLGEGDYARAAFHLKKSLKIYESVYEQTGDPPWRLESEGWWSLRIVTGDMGEFEEELRLIDVYNDKQSGYAERFETSYNYLMAERGWPLMKLGRFSEAKYWGQQGVASDSNWQTSLGWNVLCATAGEEGLRQEAMDACSAALEHALESEAGVAVDASNASNAAMAVFDFDKVEEFARLSTRSGDGTTVSAWINLIQLYLSQGRADAAIDAVSGSLDSLASEEPAMRLQKRADVDGAFALVLLVGGQEQSAFEKIDRALRFPDRRGVISTSEAQSQGSHTLLRWIARRMLKEREAEKVASQGWWERFRHWWASWFVDPEDEIDQVAVRTILQEDSYLLSTIRPYLDKGLTGVPSWLIPDLVTVLGAGVVEHALVEAREIDSFEGAEGYYQALEAEIAYSRGEWLELLEVGASARQTLPDIERLMRARILALEGVALGKLGRAQEQLAHFEKVMEIDPSVFRRLQIAVPAVFGIADGLNQDVVDALRRSPRFVERAEGFAIRVQSGQVCINGRMGQQLSCAAFPTRGEDATDAEYVTQITEAFHTLAFALSTGMSTSDWNSLDGRATSSKQRSQKKMKELLQRER